MLDYKPYERLRAAVLQHHAPAIAHEWETLWSVMRRPWPGRLSSRGQLDGHIPYDLNPEVPQRVPELFATRAIYVWGAWSGEVARTQYIGIADRQTLDIGRFKNRYPDELRMAASYKAVFRAIPEEFCARCGVRYPSFEKNGIPTRDGRITRIPRASRYAKVDLRNLWHFVIPVPGAPGGRRDADLHAIETALIQHVSADLFGKWRDGERLAFPLMNIHHVGRNALVDSRLRDAYKGWLCEGRWWQEMNQLCGIGV